MSDVTHKFIVRLKEEQTVQAQGGMLYPKSEPFEHGVQVGIYQGMEKALELLRAILRDDEDERNQA